MVILCNLSQSIFIIKTSVFLAGCLEKSDIFVQWGYTRRFIVCILFLCRYFKAMHWSAIGLLTKSATFSCTWFHINSVIPQCNGEYGQWMTTQNVRKKILHALHFKQIMLIKYFSSYIKKCQTGTYFLIECTSVDKGGGGAGGQRPPSNNAFSEFCRYIWKFVGTCKPTSMPFVPTKYLKYQLNFERNNSFRMWKCNFFRSLVPLARIYIDCLNVSVLPAYCR